MLNIIVTILKPLFDFEKLCPIFEQCSFSPQCGRHPEDRGKMLSDGAILMAEFQRWMRISEKVGCVCLAEAARQLAKAAGSVPGNLGHSAHKVITKVKNSRLTWLVPINTFSLCSGKHFCF